MKIIDTHFHFYDDCGAPEEYWDEIHVDGLEYAIAVGADLEESRLARDFAHKIDHAWFAAGAHPHSAEKYVTDGIGAFEEFRDCDRLVAVGEIGLDYFYETSQRKIQWQVMEKFLELSLEWQLPAIIHCRDKDECDDSYDDCYRMLKDFAESGGRFELHCYAGTIAWVEKFLDLGAYLGVTGMVTFNKAQNIREVLKYIPNDRLLLETDSPYLAPVPHRGKTNNPGYLINVAKKVAEVKNISVEDCAEITTANAAAFFNLDLLK